MFGGYRDKVGGQLEASVERLSWCWHVSILVACRERLRGPAQQGGDVLPKAKVQSEGTRCSGPDRSCREEKDSGTPYTLREKCLTHIILRHLEDVSGTRQPGQIPPPWLTCCVTWSKSLDLSETWFPHL